MELPAGFVADFAQRGQEPAAIRIIAEDGFAAVAAIHQVIDGSRELDPQRPWHASTTTSRHPLSIVSTDPAPTPSRAPWAPDPDG